MSLLSLKPTNDLELRLNCDTSLEASLVSAAQFVSSRSHFASLKSALVPPVANSCSCLALTSLSFDMYSFSPVDFTYLLTQNLSLHPQLTPPRWPLFLTSSQGCCCLPWLPAQWAPLLLHRETEVSPRGPSSLRSGLALTMTHRHPPSLLNRRAPQTTWHFHSLGPLSRSLKLEPSLVFLVNAYSPFKILLKNDHS